MSYTKTPTPQFQALSNKPKAEILAVFLEHLKTNFPIPDDVKVTLTLSNRSEKSQRSYAKGKPVYGSITMHRDKRTADITILEVSERETPLLLRTLAHEYKHATQTFVDCVGGWGATAKDSNIKHEVEAEIFGVFKSRMFCYGW